MINYQRLRDVPTDHIIWFNNVLYRVAGPTSVVDAQGHRSTLADVTLVRMANRYEVETFLNSYISHAAAKCYDNKLQKENPMKKFRYIEDVSPGTVVTHLGLTYIRMFDAADRTEYTDLLLANNAGHIKVHPKTIVEVVEPVEPVEPKANPLTDVLKAGLDEAIAAIPKGAAELKGSLMKLREKLG